MVKIHLENRLYGGYACRAFPIELMHLKDYVKVKNVSRNLDEITCKHCRRFI